MKISSLSNSVQSKTTEELMTSVCAAHKLLQDLSSLTTLGHDDLLGRLLQLMNLCSREMQGFSELNSAVTLCWRAEYYNLGKDPLIEEWASWPQRHKWLILELDAAISHLQGTTITSEHSVTLNSFREKYRDDGEGYPRDIWNHFDKHKERKTLAFARADLYAAGEVIERAEGDGKLNSRLFIDMLNSWGIEYGFNETIEKSRALADTLQSPSQMEKIPIAWRLYGECLATICSTEHSLFSALLGKSIKTVQEFSANTAITLFNAHTTPPLHFWNELDQAQLAFREISSNYPVFDISELNNLSDEGRFDIISLRFKGRFITAALVMNDDTVLLPRTQEKLQKFGDLSLRNKNVHAWQFLNVADPHALYSLRHMRIDWSMILRDAITDVSLIRGREDVLGIVELDNHAMKAHRRLGFTPLQDKLLFISDDGKSAAIQRRSFYNPFSE